MGALDELGIPKSRWSKRPLTEQEYRDAILAKYQRAEIDPFIFYKTDELPSDGSNVKTYLPDGVWGTMLDGLPGTEIKQDGTLEYPRNKQQEIINLLTKLTKYTEVFKYSNYAKDSVPTLYSTNFTSAANAFGGDLTPGAPGADTRLIAVQFLGCFKTMLIESDDAGPVLGLDIATDAGAFDIKGFPTFIIDEVTTDGDNAWVFSGTTAGAEDKVHAWAWYVLE